MAVRTAVAESAMATPQPAAAHGACGRKNRHGGPCQLRAGFGTDHPGSGACKHHGGSTPSGRKHAATEAAELALQKMGVPIPTDPAQGLFDMVATSAGMVAFLRVKASEVDSLVVNTAFGPAVDPHQALLAGWVKIHARNCKLALDANISERYVRIAEQQGAAIVELIRRVLAKSGLQSEQRRELEQLFGAELRAMVPEGGPSLPSLFHVGHAPTERTHAA